MQKYYSLHKELLRINVNDSIVYLYNSLDCLVNVRTKYLLYDTNDSMNTVFMFS